MTIADQHKTEPDSRRPASRDGEAALWLNLTRITTIRIIVQTLMFSLFLAFLVLTTFSHLDEFPNLRYWVGKILEVDPLIAIATALATHTVYKGLLWSLVILIPTFFLGRFFCEWVCPYGILHHVVGWLLHGFDSEQMIEANRYKPMYRVKYYILTALLVAALFGTLQIGLIDPICLIYRSFTGAMLPTAELALFGDSRVHQGAWLIGFVLFGLVAMNLVIPRFFCRVLCPLGALLGVLSRFAWWRIERDPAACVGCNRCLTHCEGACDPHAQLRTSECVLCFNCIEDCPEGALRFAFMPPTEHEVIGPDVSRRKVIFAAVTGALFFPFVRTSGPRRAVSATKQLDRHRDSVDVHATSSRLIRPPGSLDELNFLSRCIKCNQCVRVCPTNALQPAWFESGLEGLWTPIFNFRIGHCQLNCTACTRVCPTGAIERLSIDRKLGQGDFTDTGPIRIGTAHIDPARCLPISKGIPCVVCEEVCPTSPKAIYGENLLPAAGRSATAPPQQEIRVPRVDANLCIGCGICERFCPVVGERGAIFITADGQTRSEA